jgi:hypothetical protein
MIVFKKEKRLWWKFLSGGQQNNLSYFLDPSTDVLLSNEQLLKSTECTLKLLCFVSIMKSRWAFFFRGIFEIEVLWDASRTGHLESLVYL